VKFTIPTEPVPKLRPRVVRQGGFPRAFTPQKTLDFEATVKIAALAAGMVPCLGPIVIRAEFYHRLPKAKERKRRPIGEQPKPTKPDLDNLLKSLLDGMEGVCFDHDSAVVRINAGKWWAAQGDEPRIDVEIEQL